MEKASLCARCGKCLTACPVYQVTKEEPLSPRGRLALLEKGLIVSSILYDCLLCGACERACPNEIPLLDFFLEARFRAPSSWAEVLPWLQAIGAQRKKSFQRQNFLPSQGKVALFLGCGANFLYPETALKVSRFLRDKGLDLYLPATSGCCGLPYLSLGRRDQFLVSAKRCLESLAEAQRVLTFCASCLYTIQVLYPRFLRNTPLASLARETSLKIEEIGTFLLESGLCLPRESPYFLFQIPCHLRHIDKKNLWSKFGISIYEGCCGEGGLFGLRHRSQSRLIVRELFKALEKAPKTSLVTACTSCWMALRRHFPQLSVKFLPEALLDGSC